MLKLILKKTNNAKDDILSGLTVALALVPEAVAFAFVADIPPIIGLYGAFMVGLITSIFGGRPGMISGATGALAVVMVHLVKEGREMSPDIEFAGLQYLFATLILMGIIQMSAGFLKLGKFVRLIPHPVMMGFVNGLAIVIFTSQLGMFKIGGEYIDGGPLYMMLGLVALTMAIMYFLPKLTKKVPAGLVAILTVSAIVIFGGIETETVLSFVQSKATDGQAASIEGGLPSFAIPNIALNWETLSFIFPYALILAAIGLIESLMTLQ
ncbi:MAG: SulP family inorganic anion transporter, partial [Flavobacteriales bacterium]|nr:SulP family inorganic anion transporter [Flavobacteriales bacterium]